MWIWCTHAHAHTNTHARAHTHSTFAEQRRKVQIKLLGWKHACLFNVSRGEKLFSRQLTLNTDTQSLELDMHVSVQSRWKLELELHFSTLYKDTYRSTDLLLLKDKVFLPIPGLTLHRLKKYLLHQVQCWSSVVSSHLTWEQEKKPVTGSHGLAQATEVWDNTVCVRQRERGVLRSWEFFYRCCPVISWV